MITTTETTRDKRNIMILFLSSLHPGNYKTFPDGSKMISKFANYKICQSSPKEEVISCVETNEAPLMEVLRALGDEPLHAIFYFATKKLRKKEWRAVYPPSTEGRYIPVLYESDADFFWRGRANAIAREKLYNTELYPIDFDEDEEDPMKGSIEAVKALETGIKQYLAAEHVLLEGEKPLSNCHLFADITGGMRTTNMVMSAAIQLLRYEDAKLDYVVYSDFDFNRTINPVSNVQPINDMYRLVAGMDAFEKYGSSAALNEYFDDVKSQYGHLQTLLDAMNLFSEAVLLCQPDLIEKHLQTLVAALEAFPTEEPREKSRPAKVELFARMLRSLKLKYLGLLQKPNKNRQRKANRLAIIRWCVKNSLLQQAVTFCTEWLPEYLLEHGVIYTDDIAIQAYCQSREFPNYRTGKKNFLMEFCTKSPLDPTKNKLQTGLDLIAEHAKMEEIPRELRKIIADAALRRNLYLPSNCWAPASDRWGPFETDFSPMRHFLEELPQEVQTVQGLLQDGPIDEDALPPRTRELVRLLKRLYRPKKNTFHTARSWQENVLAEYSSSIVKRLILYFYKGSLKNCENVVGPMIKSKKVRFYRYDKNKEDRYNAQETSQNGKMGESCAKTTAILHTMLDCGMVNTMFDTNTALDFARKYTYIKKELRNKMNHAKEGDEKGTGKASGKPRVIVPTTIDGVADYLNGFLDSLEIVKDKHHTCVGLWTDYKS